MESRKKDKKTEEKDRFEERANQTVGGAKRHGEMDAKISETNEAERRRDKETERDRRTWSEERKD